MANSAVSWRAAAYRTARPILFALEPETVHHLTLRALTLAGRSKAGRALCRLASGIGTDGDAIELIGLRFRNRVGLAAGFDKDGVAVRGWEALGLGFVELGTVTPEPQPGNPRPRLFRLSGDRALVNRMGFNNAGAGALARRIAAARPELPDGFVVGVNIGRNRTTPDEAAADDYLAAYGVVAGVADYVAINVSSPNTPGLRGLQRSDWLRDLLERIDRQLPRRPLVVKLSPDLDEAARDELIDALLDSPARGVILSNTTLARDGLRSPDGDEAGGLSGVPLRGRTLVAVERARERAGARLAIIASGGIASGEDARAAIDAGADLVQLWTGLVYRGPGLIGEAIQQTR